MKEDNMREVFDICLDGDGSGEYIEHIGITYDEDEAERIVLHIREVSGDSYESVYYEKLQTDVITVSDITFDENNNVTNKSIIY